MIGMGANGGSARNVALVMFMLLGFPQAQAADAGRPLRLISEGLELRRAGQDLEALTKFEEAYRVDSTPRAAAQWGLCLQAVGRWSEADGLLSEALKAKSDPWVVKNRTILKDSLEQVKQNVGRIEVFGGPDGSTVSINGRNVGVYPLPGPVSVNAGNVDVEVTKGGFKRGYRSVSVGGGQYQRLLIRLEEEQGKNVVAAPQPPNLHPAPEPPPEGTLVEALPNDLQQPTPLYKKPLIWIAVGVVVAAGVVAVVLSSGGGGTTGPQVNEQGNFGR